MKKTVLDTSFILTCVKQKIDFFEQLEEVLIPKQVISELKRVSESKKKLKYREDAKLALKILEKNSFKEIDIGKGHVDNGIKKLAEENPKLIVATLDKEIKNKIKNPKLIVRGKKKLEIIQ